MSWQPRGRDLYFVPPDVGGSVRIGEIDWCESLSQNSAEGCIHVAIGNNSFAPYGGFSASRTSDTGGIGHMALAYQDSRSPGGGAWGHYVEGFVAADAHPDNTLFGVEYGIVNKRNSCADVTPHRISYWGIVDGIRVGVGKPGCGGKEISSMMTFANVEGAITSIARKGLVFAYDAIKMVALLGRRFGEVLAMAKGHGFRWYDSSGNPGSTIVCNTDNAAYAPHIEFTNGAIHFLGADGISQFSFNTMTGALYLGNGAVGPNGTIRFFVGGVPYLVTARPE